MPCMMSFSMPFRTASMDPTPPDHIQSRPVATPMAVLRSPTPALSRASRYARDFGGARLNLSYSAAADSEAIEFSQSYSQAKPHLCTPPHTSPPLHHPYTTHTCVRTQFCCATSSWHAISLSALSRHSCTPVPPVPPVYHPYPRPVVPLLCQPALP